MDRRDFLKTGLAASAAIGLAPSLKGWVPQHNWHKYDFGPGPQVKDRLYQGPFPSYAPENYFVDNCYLLIDSKKYAKQILLGFGKIEGGTVRNVLPSCIHLEGTLRTVKMELNEEVIRAIFLIIEELSDLFLKVY